MISLAALGHSFYVTDEPREQQLWDLLAFLGRYAHQDIEKMLDWDVTTLYELARSTTKLLKEEAEAVKK